MNYAGYYNWSEGVVNISLAGTIQCYGLHSGFNLNQLQTVKYRYRTVVKVCLGSLADDNPARTLPLTETGSYIVIGYVYLPILYIQ